MARRFESLYRGYARFLNWLGVFSGLITFAIMWLIVANSLMRKGFNHPIQGTYEITEACLVLLVFLSIAYTQCRRGHIRVILFTRHLPMMVQHVLYIVVLFIACLFFAWCAYAAWGDAVRSYKLGEQEWGLIRFPLWPVKGALFAGVALLSLQFLLDTIRHTFVIRGQLPPIGNEP